MALVPVGRTVVADPTAGLQAALAEFKNSLSDEQRVLFNISATIPHDESTTLFIADIAARNQGAKGKHLWKRLCTFLQATQQFTSIIDTLANANPVAALIWGGVKTTILAANNSAFYFDQVTSMLEGIGRACPIFDGYGRIFVGHQGVQHAICSYYAIVVRLCAKVVVGMQRSGPSHVVATFLKPFNLDFQPFLGDLKRAAKEVDDQVSLATKQAIVNSARLLQFESQANTSHRFLSSMFRSEVKKEWQETMQAWRETQLQLQSQSMVDEIQENLSQVKYHKAWRLALQPLVPGTAEWFEKEIAFQEWMSDKHSDFLWCSGAMGVGKTVLVSNIIAHLFERAVRDRICYHFCRPDDESSLTSRGVLGTIVRQMIDFNDVGLEHLRRTTERSRSLGDQDVIDFVLPWLKIDTQYYVIIDGLDECQADEIVGVRHAIIKLQLARSGNIKVLYSGRPELETLLFPRRAQHRLVLSQSKVQDDLDQYIDTTLHQCLEDEVLKLCETSSIVEIAQSLKDGADGMFLWAKLFIGEICTCINEREIMKALEKPPRGIDNLLHTILARIKDDSKVEHVKRTIQCCLVAKRPMYCSEMGEAISIEDSQRSLERDRIPSGMERVVSACRGLLFIDGVDSTIHVVHHSVKAYFFNATYKTRPNASPRKADESFDALTEDLAEIELGTKCLKYLNFSDFQRQVTRLNANGDIPLRPIDLGLGPISSTGRFSKQAAQKLLSQSRFKSIRMRELDHTTQQVTGGPENQRLEREIHANQYHFLEYARVHWIYHFKKLTDEKSEAISALFRSAVVDEHLLAKKPWLSTDASTPQNLDRGKAERIFEWAVQENHSALLTVAVAEWQPTLDNAWFEPSFLEACRLNRDLLVRIFVTYMTSGKRQYNFGSYLDTIAHGFHIAASEGNTTVVSVLIDSGISPDVKFEGSTALRSASGKGHFRVVTLLLDHGASIGKNNADTRLLDEAMASRSINVVEAFLLAGHAWSGGFVQELYTLLQNAQLDTVKRILEADTRRRGLGEGLLTRAIEEGDLAMIHWLVRNCRQTMAPGPLRITVLRAIANGAEARHFEALFDPDIGLEGQKPLSQLELSIIDGDPELIQSHIASGADARGDDPDEVPPIHLAADLGRVAAVRLLVENGASIHRLFCGRIPIELARRNGHTRVVEYLEGRAYWSITNN